MTRSMELGAPQVIRKEGELASWFDPTGPRALLWIVVVGAAIRLYLCVANYCISGDGAAYLGMAKDYATGNWRAPLASVFSPLYPLLIAGLHWFVSDWELAGNLVSTLMGVGALISIYLLMREVYGRREIALGAAALAAIHPALAAYSASVRTETGYILLTTTATWLLLKATGKKRVGVALLCGLVTGLAYLYRTEALGFIVLSATFPIAAALLYHQLSGLKALWLGLVIFASASALAIPYLILVHAVTGVWTLSRELTAAIMFGLGSVTGDWQHWRKLAFASDTSVLSALASHPWGYLEKIAGDFLISFYSFLQAAGPVLALLLPVGLWKRGRLVSASAKESLLAFVVVFYFCGFAVTMTGARFMIHLIPYTLGWGVIGLEVLTRRVVNFVSSSRYHVPAAMPAALAAMIMLPQTLWPIGYDMRGVRYAGEAIALSNHDRAAVAARDGRVAWYAGAHSVQLPSSANRTLCEWLTLRPEVGYLLLDNHDELRLAVSPKTTCLQLISRYPRYGSGYYDLYSVKKGPAAS